MYCKMDCMGAILFAPVTGCSERTSSLQASSPFCSPTFIMSCRGGPDNTCASKNDRLRVMCWSYSETLIVIGTVIGSARSTAVSIESATTPTYALETNLKGFHSSFRSRTEVPPTVCQPPVLLQYRSPFSQVTDSSAVQGRAVRMTLSDEDDDIF